MPTIAITFDLHALSSYTDTHLAALWHVGQANPAPIEDRQAGDIAERIGREIIRRWLERSRNCGRIKGRMRLGAKCKTYAIRRWQRHQHAVQRANHRRPIQIQFERIGAILRDVR